MRARALALALAATLVAGCRDAAGPSPGAGVYALREPFALGPTTVLADTLRFGYHPLDGKRVLQRTLVTRHPRATVLPGEPTHEVGTRVETMPYAFRDGRVYADRPCMSIAPPAGTAGGAAVLARCTKAGPDVDGYLFGGLLRVRSFGLPEYHDYEPVP